MARQTEVTYFCDICGAEMSSTHFQFEARWVHSPITVKFDVCKECRENADPSLPTDPTQHQSLYAIVRKLFKRGLKKHGH